MSFSESDLSNKEHETDADAKRVLAHGKTSGGAYVPIQVDSSGNVFISNIDISDQTNLAVTSPIVLTNDTLSFDFTTDNTWSGSNVFSESYGGDVETDDGNSSTADTIDWGNSNFHKSTLTGNVTYTFTAPTPVGIYILKVVQGSGPYTITWPATVKFPANIDPVLSQGSGDVDVFTFYFDGTNYNCIGASFDLS